MVEHFSWKCVAPGELVLKMHTSATKATVLSLPAGYVWGFISVFTFSFEAWDELILYTVTESLFPKT